MSEETLARARAKRGGNRTVLTKVANEAHDLLKDEILNRQRLETLAESLREKLEIVKSLDETIIEQCKVEDIEHEIEESHEINERAIEIRRRIINALAETSSDKSDNMGISTETNAGGSGTNEPLMSHESPSISGDQPTNVSSSLNTANPSIHETGSFGVSGAIGIQQTTHVGIATQPPGSSGTNFQLPFNSNFSGNANPTAQQSKAKLPKLVLPKFRGDVTQWQNFWDSFNSSIHTNLQLSQIDKFNHLHSLLEGQAARSIQGLPRTEANYNAAIDTLHKRFGKPQNIISKHMDEMLKITGCINDNASQLRAVYDRISINIRGLESLGVSSNQYGSLLIPVIMSKMPPEIRVQIARSTAREVWDMSELLDVIRQEVEARELSDGVKANVNLDKQRESLIKRPSSSTLLTQDDTQPSKKGPMKCVYCTGLHYSASCENVIDPTARFEILKKDRRCYVCLKTDHQSGSCNKSCRRCRGNHHQSICRQLAPKPSELAVSSNQNPHEARNSTLVSLDNPQSPETTTTASSATKGTVLLQTASAIARNEDGSKTTRVKILFDSGSQRSYVTDSLKSRLGLKSKEIETLYLNTFGEKNFRKQKCDVVTLLLDDLDNEPSKISALSFPTICSALSSRVNISHYPHLHGLHLADCSNPQDSIDVLIGSDHYWDFVTTEIVRGEFGPTAINSKFGWLLSGPTECVTSSETTVTNLIISGTSDSLFDQAQDPLIGTLKKFWETESIGIKGESEIISSSDSFNENVRFNGQRYEVQLPWKENYPTVPSDYELCVNRLRSLQRKLLKEPELMKEYNQIIEEQVNNGIVEGIPTEETMEKMGENVHYLPHHAVVRRDRETTKLRIVYDGSATSPERAHSLNDCLQTGPNFTPQIFDTLVKFRWHKIGLTADIEKAFLMVGISETDRDMLRFLWLKDPKDLNSEIAHFRFTRLVFGLRPSPAILASTIRHHLDALVSEEFKPEFIEALKNSLYVDDLVTGEENEAKTMDLYLKSKSVMQRGGFNLRKWKTNSKVVQDAINRADDCANSTVVSEVKKIVTEEDESYAKTTNGPLLVADKASDNAIVKVLGSVWNTATDHFVFDLVDLSGQAKKLPTTKRSLLKISAKIFDPIGVLSPFTIQWKILFQELCNERADWDEQLKDDHLKKWNSLICQLQTLNSVSIPRCYFDDRSCNLRSVELHCFSDASEKAYAAVVYLRSIYEDGRIDVNLVASKTRVAPLKKQSIPRLELLGATILVRLAKAVQNALPQKLEPVYWVDSMTVLCWIRNVKPWKQYVMNRVQEIREHTTPESWKFCPGDQNPADNPSRGMTAGELVAEKRWWKGPEFLYKPEGEWPEDNDTYSDNGNALEETVRNPAITTHALITTSQVQLIGVHQIIDATRYSSWKKLLRVTAYVLRFVKKANVKRSLELEAEEIRSAEGLWIKSIQCQSFAEEVCHMITSGKTPAPLLVRQFNLYLDEKGLIRCRGRIQNSSLNQEVKTPMLLPSRHHVVELIIRDTHDRMLHSGVNTTLTTIRERFWIIRGRQTVKRILRRCVPCRRIEGNHFPIPQQPELPKERVSDDPPFTHTGVDFAGPLYTSEKVENTEDAKVYVCLFTCASTRAVHLELTKRLSTEAFMLAFRRFTSRRGLPATMLSDNAKTFKSASKNIVKIVRAKEVIQYMSNNGLTWKFIVEKAAWWGGFWERLVQTVKRALKKVIGRSCLSFEELRTLLVEVESIVNARPLTYVYDDLDGISFALTPSHLINGRRLQSTSNASQFEIVSTYESLTRRSRHQKRLLYQFTEAWRRDYLVSLREAHAASTRRSGDAEIMVGDVVLLQNDKTKRVLWKLAIVKELLTGVDGKVRAAVVQVSGSKNLLKRSVKHLIPIEVQSNCDALAAPERPDQSEVSHDREIVVNRPRRRAAIDGELLRRLRL